MRAGGTAVTPFCVARRKTREKTLEKRSLRRRCHRGKSGICAVVRAHCARHIGGQFVCAFTAQQGGGIGGAFGLVCAQGAVGFLSDFSAANDGRFNFRPGGRYFGQHHRHGDRCDFALSSGAVCRCGFAENTVPQTIIR